MKRSLLAWSTAIGLGVWCAGYLAPRPDATSLALSASEWELFAPAQASAAPLKKTPPAAGQPTLAEPRPLVESHATDSNWPTLAQPKQAQHLTAPPTPAETPPSQPGLLAPGEARPSPAIAEPTLLGPVGEEPTTLGTEDLHPAADPVAADVDADAAPEDLTAPPAELFATEPTFDAPPLAAESANNSIVATPGAVKNTPLGAEAGLTLAWKAPESANLDQQTPCELIVRNAGAASAEAVTVRLELPAGARLAQADPPPAEEAGVFVWRLGRLAPRDVQTIHLALVATQEGDLSPSADVTFTRAASTRIAVLRPQLELTIEGAPQVVSGQRAAYFVVVANRGSGAAANVSVEALLPEGLHAGRDGQLSYQIGALAAGETRRVEVPIAGREAGEYAIAARVVSGGRPAAQARFDVEIIRPQLQMVLDGPKLRYLDRKATYTIKVQNPGPAPINNVQVFQQVPQGFRFLEASAGGSFDGAVRQVAWFVGRLDPNQTAEVDVELAPVALGEHRFTAAVKADAGVNESAETTTRVDGAAAVKIELVDADDPVEVHGRTSYQIRLTNHGSRPARGVQVAALLPPEMQALEVDGPTDGEIDGERIVFAPLAELAPGATENFTVRVECGQPGQVRFRAYFRTDDSPEPVVEEELTRIYQD